MKMPNFAANAVFAKVRCLYGKRLTAKNYNDLLALHSVNDIAEYLRTKTAYSEIFEGLNVSGEWQRSQLETLLYNKMYNDCESVIRFQKAAGSDLYEYFILKYDTQQIVNVLSSLETKRRDYLFTFPVFYNERSHLNLYRLAQAKTQEDILDGVKGTPYYDTFRDALTKYRVLGNLTVVQAEFRNFLDGEFVKLVAGKKKKTISEKNELGNLYRTMKDVHLIKILYRMKRFTVAPEIIDTIRNPLLTHFTPKQIDTMLLAPDAASLDAIVSETYLGGIVTEQSDRDLSHRADEYLADVFTKAIRRSQDPGTVMFAYCYLCENEIKNIIHIIEGIRYGLSPIEILPMLSGACATK